MKFVTVNEFFNFIVTPYAGVWIEIDIVNNKDNAIPSLPTRECGLKFYNPHNNICYDTVTPYAGVWIEIKNLCKDL